jgi:hypothetical protein
MENTEHEVFIDEILSVEMTNDGLYGTIMGRIVKEHESPYCFSNLQKMYFYFKTPKKMKTLSIRSGCCVYVKVDQAIPGKPFIHK